MSLALVWAEARGGVIGYEGRMPWHLPEDLAHFRELTSGGGDGGAAHGGAGAAGAPGVVGEQGHEGGPGGAAGLPAVVMGRRTWESLPERFRPLPGRRNLVLTRDRAWASPGAEVMQSLDAAATAVGAGTPDGAVLWVIGGGELYREAMRSPLSTRLEVTELDLGVKGDTSAPRIDGTWSRIAESPWLESRTGIRYRFVTHAR